MRRRVLALPLALTLAALPVHAQRGRASAPASTARPVELGIDAAFAFTSSTIDSPIGDFTTRSFGLELPVRRVRAGFFLTDAVSLEPSLGLSVTRFTNERESNGDDRSSTVRTVNLDVGLLFHLTPARRPVGWFVRPFVGLDAFGMSAGDNDNSATRARLGAGLGYKKALADRFQLRTEGLLARSFESDDFPAETRLALNVGFSFLTR